MKYSEGEAKRSWEPMQLSSVGHISQVVEGGGGKLSVMTDDMGDRRKPKGQE
ncbi:MAG: hypothetical protein H0T57_15670 [Rubrobacter sp.]|nr:hypothetical protein [Rubrobacter sp.]